MNGIPSVFFVPGKASYHICKKYMEAENGKRFKQ